MSPQTILGPAVLRITSLNTEGDWPSRREASLRAFFEWMPVREQPAGLDKEKLWRHFSFGDLATLTTLETRHTGRSIQVSYNEHLERIENNNQRDRFLGEVLGDPNRTILSNEMENFLAKSLKDSVSNNTTWRIIGNQIPIARTHVPDVGNRITPETIGGNSMPESHNQFSRLGELDLPLYLDTWDGYPAARQGFYNLCRDAGPATSSSLPAIVMLFGPMNSMMAPISQWVWSLARPVLLRQEILRITVRKAQQLLTGSCLSIIVK